MAEPTLLTHHLETYVDVTRSPTHQDASLEAVAALVKKDALTLELLVREMEMYLTTTDNVIRARGILLLAEILKRLESKPLDEAIIHTLVGFFADRLVDWRALRGALVGCLALIGRKSNVGSISVTDAHAVAKTFSDKVHVQSLGQYDRKLCFELLGCLLDCYPEAAKPLGEKLVFDTCEAIDGEKDPECLMLAFHMVEPLAQIFPDPCGPLGANASDLFDVLGCYFPLHFTHPKGDGIDIKRDDLSRALMLAFSASPLFEPFAIPLLLEKLSSSLPIAKVDSLKYLNDCALKYGAERMAKHYESLWSSLKDAVYTSNGDVLSFSPESLNDTRIQENEILKEALNLLKRLIKLDITFLTFILDDTEVKTIFGTIYSFNIYEEIPHESKQKLHAICRILSVSAKASTSSCNRVFEMFFLRLMDILGISAGSSSDEHSPKKDSALSYRNQDGALYLCTELLAASRDLLLDSKNFPLASDYSHETWCSILKNSSVMLTQVFTSAVTHDNDAPGVHIYLGVKGLQILGTLAGGYSLVSKAAFEKILSTFTNIISKHSKRTSAWKLALKALVHIGSSIDRCHETEKILSFMDIVVNRVVQMASLEQLDMVYSLRLEVVSEICKCGPDYMLKIVQALEDALYGNLSKIFALETSEAIPNVVKLLQCFCNHLLPWISEIGGSEEILRQFAVGIWHQIETCSSFNCQVLDKELVEAVMMSMKLAVGICSIESQNAIIQEASSVVSSSSLQLSHSQPSAPVVFENVQVDNMCSRDEWILSLFASVIMAVSPQAHIPDLRSVIHLFLISVLRGHVASAQALGSIVNKLGPVSYESNDCSLEDAITTIFHTAFSVDKDLIADGYTGSGSRSDINIIKLCSGGLNGSILQIHAITGLAWIGKGLLMRGHERIKDITMVFLECLTASSKTTVLPQGAPNINSEQIDRHVVMKCAADAFQILMCDSNVCLNRKFHAVIRPLYKQRYFSTAVPILESLLLEPNSSPSRAMLYRAFTRVVTDTPMMVILDNSKRLIPLMLESLSILSDKMDKDMLLSLLLVLSGILTSEKGQEVAIERAHTIVNCLVKLTSYPHMMLVRETAVQCLIAISGMPYRRIYPLRTQVLRAISKALGDPKRDVRREAIRCRQAWASIA